MKSAKTIDVVVVDAGAIPLVKWGDGGYWKLARGQPEPDQMPPRVLLEVSEEGARALAAHIGNTIRITVPAPEEGGPP